MYKRQALQDVNDYIASVTVRHMKVSMKSIYDRFQKAPYGFVEADIQWLIAKLFKDGDITLFVNSEVVTRRTSSDDEILRYLTRKEFLEKLMMEKQVKANEKQKKAVREVMKELFRVSSASEDDESLMNSFLNYAANLKTELEKLEIRYSSQPKYPGKAVITSGKQLLCQVLPIKYPAEFFSAVDAARDDFLDFAEDYEPVRKFFTGDQISIFDRGIRLMKIFDDSKTFIVNDEVENTVGQIKAIMQKPAPYSDIFKLPALLDQYIRAYDEVLQTMEEPVLAAIEDAKSRVFAELEGKESKPQFMGKFVAKFQELHDKATSSNNVATLQNIKVEADALKVRCLNEISDAETKILARKAAEDAQRRAQADAAQAASGKRPETPTPQPAPEPPKPKIKKQKTVSIKSINTSNTWQLESADDVRRYVSELQDKLMRALEKDTVINIEF